MKKTKNRISTGIVLVMLTMVLMGVNDCSQQANINMQHIGNFFSYPFKAAADLANGTNDSAIRERYGNFVNAGSPTSGSGSGANSIQCNPDSTPISPVGDTLENIQQRIIAQNCVCAAWDVPAVCVDGHNCCSDTACPREVQCPLLCPENIDILHNNKRRAPPVTASGNYFSFLNSAFDVFPNEVRPLDRSAVTNSIPASGYNLGMISARRKFNELATFSRTPVPNFHGSESEKKRYYMARIDDIMDNKPASVPGYGNLAEFSADPLIQKYLKQKVAEEWHNKAIGNDPFSEKKVNPAHNMTRERATSMLADVNKGIGEMGSVTLAFGYVTASRDEVPAQALEAYKTFKDSNNNDVICVHDPNLPAYPVNLGPNFGTAPSLHFPFADPPKACFPSVVVKANGETTYTGKVRTFFDPPRVERDEDGIEVTKRYDDTLVDRPLFDVHHFKLSDQRDAVMSIPRLTQQCLQDRGCVE